MYDLCGPKPSSPLLLTLLDVCRFTLFASRKPNVNQDWQRKLPDFVKRLEEALYRAARSKVSQMPRLLGPAFPLVSTILPGHPSALRTHGPRRLARNVSDLHFYGARERPTAVWGPLLAVGFALWQRWADCALQLRAAPAGDLTSLVAVDKAL